LRIQRVAEAFSINVAKRFGLLSQAGAGKACNSC